MDGARLTLLRVLTPPAEAADARATDAIAWEVEREQAKAYVRKMAVRLGEQGAVVEGRVTEGSPAHEIKSQALLGAADLIVISTHGEGGDEAWELGSTARKILELAGSALLVVPGHPRQAPPTSLPLRRIFVPLDGSLRGECALPTALRLARAEGAEVIVAHVVSDPIRSGVLYTDADLALASDLTERLFARADAYLEQVRARIVESGPKGTKAVTRATDHRAGLVSLATSMDADIVVLTAHGSVCDTRRRFGSVTSYFLSHSTSPVLVLQDLPDKERSSMPPSSSRPPPRSVDAAEPR
jgi:nucleotide-binding universal stress UspA family protein